MSTIVYLHGFLSSPESVKAQHTQQWLAENRADISYCCPALSSYPREAKHTLDQLVEQQRGEPCYAIGSSLGGFWATYLVENSQFMKAVLINPAVSPQRYFAGIIGKELKSYYTEEKYCLTENDARAFEEIDCHGINYPEKYWLMVQQGDETLDYRLAAEKYGECKQLIEPKGNHSFEGYEGWLPKIIDFFED